MKEREALKLALEAWERGDGIKLGEILKKALAQPEQEPVAFLANGTRFKISYDSRQSGGQIHGIPPELGGRWVAFVAAEDDCHLKLTTPPQRTWVGLTTEDRVEILRAKGEAAVMQITEAKLKEKNT